MWSIKGVTIIIKYMVQSIKNIGMINGKDNKIKVRHVYVAMCWLQNSTTHPSGLRIYSQISSPEQKNEIGSSGI